MSREEAIEVIRKEYACVDADCDIERNCGRCELHMPSKEPILKAYEMAIKALSQESCDNAISRQAVLDGLKGCMCEDWVKTLFATMVKQLPSVTQKSGKWIKHPEIETSAPEYLMFYECSECGGKQCFYKSDIHKKRFCSNCGAKMVEPQESEDKE